MWMFWNIAVIFWDNALIIAIIIYRLVYDLKTEARIIYILKHSQKNYHIEEYWKNKHYQSSSTEEWIEDV